MTSRPRVCVFIGPSVRPGDVEDWTAELPADVLVLAPVQQGDLLRVAELAPTHVCIVDGAFFQVPSVSHKEILLTLERGVRVLGAASLGALRAAELDQFGMEGVGAIYQLYRSGAIDGDDEVAVLHADAGREYASLTDPLVSIRHNLRRARARHLITKATASAVLASARALHFTHRTYGAALAGAAPHVAPDELARLGQFLQHDAVDLKRADALALLSLLKRRLAGAEPWPVPPVVRTHRTVYAHLFAREYQGRSRDGQYVTDAFVLSLYKLLAPTAVRTRRRVAFRSLAVEEARRSGLQPFSNRTIAQDWLDERCLSAEEGHAALCERDLEQRVLTSSPPGPAYRRLVAATAARVGLSPLVLLSAPRMQPGIPWDGPLLREVKMSGAFRPMFEYACQVQQFAAETAHRLPGLTESLALARLEAWAARKWGISDTGLGHALVRRGFTSYREFVEVARPAYVYEWLGSAGKVLRDAALAQQ
jgi:hypothetical protein